MIDQNQKSFLKKIIPATAILGGLCCFTPVVLVLFGLSSVAFAASLSDVLYGSYKWLFRGLALLFLLVAIGWYFYKKEGVCSIDAVKRKKNKIINVVLIALISAVITYVLWLYVIVELLGKILGLW